MQAFIQSCFEAFRLFLVFSGQTKPNKTLHLNVSRSEQKKHLNTEIRLPFYFLIQIGFIICLFCRFSRHTLTDVTNTGNGEPGTGVWELVYSGNLPEMAYKGKEKGLANSFEHVLFERDRRSKQHGR